MSYTPYTSWKSLYMKVETGTGAFITNALTDGLELSKLLNETVYLEFNGIVNRLNPDMSFDDALKEYRRGMESYVEFAHESKRNLES